MAEDPWEWRSNWECRSSRIENQPDCQPILCNVTGLHWSVLHCTGDWITLDCQPSQSSMLCIALCQPGWVLLSRCQWRSNPAHIQEHSGVRQKAGSEMEDWRSGLDEEDDTMISVRTIPWYPAATIFHQAWYHSAAIPHSTMMRYQRWYPAIATHASYHDQWRNLAMGNGPSLVMWICTIDFLQIWIGLWF